MIHSSLYPLHNIHIVMIETTLPANIGSSARAMMTAGLSHLTLVNPQKPIDATSYAHAKGGRMILDNARIVHTLDDAIADCQLIFAASSRNRHLPRPVVTPSDAITMTDGFVKAHHQHGTPKIAILFGREAHGLTNDELAMAHYHLQIPANPAYPVLNIASSIQVIGSFFYAYYANHDLTNPQSKTPLNISIRQDWDEPAITHQEQQKLNWALLQLLKQVDLTDNHLASLPNRLGRLSARLQLDKKEYALLMALIHQIQKRTQSNN